MPELPEMETYKNLLSQHIIGKTIMKVEINREKSINIEAGQFINELEQAKIVSIQRRAKHLIFNLSSGKSLLLHLMLGGWMYLGTEQDNPKRTKQVIISFGDRQLYFIGLRLGYLHLLTKSDLEKELNDLGPEPYGVQFTYSTFNPLISSKKGMLKTTLVNQHFIAGIGNCYSDEICFEARLKPTKKADSLTVENKKSLYEAIHTVFAEAIKYGGYMDHPLFSNDGLTGGYNDRCKVYDREGEPCNRCGNKIILEEVSSRKTFYCPNCQED